MGYCVYTDNFYYSPELAIALKRMDTDLVGTVRKNRKGVPKEFVKKKLARGETAALCEEEGTMLLLKWQDKRDVLCLSTHHQLGFVDVVRRGKEVQVPNVIHDYNIFMGGVDRVDQMLSAYPMERKRQKIWYKKQFRHLLNMCIHNAHVIHEKCGGTFSPLQFRESLFESIVEKHFLEKPKKGRPSAEEDPLRLRERHFPKIVTATEKKANASRRCTVCASKGKRRESRYQCTPCDVGLCVVPCFEDFHTKKKY
ncbi:piggyBac transposable element-derived protein 4-like [Nilaparvata lugens]|uniref:piggyBac transposable element-derived protein 4-like n=1 Tax=Nilaparvata lugens TaxID=108931 RepID=UPI00193D9A7E|nr:piggyBac transposable element-derived protein 4-like [Nilaparvata lugens]